MTMRRREFIGSASALVAGLASTSMLDAQQEGAPKTPPTPTRAAKVERLFKAPDSHPNALEAAPDGLWIGDQVSEKVFLVDWKSGKVQKEVQTESHNTSGIAIGGGYMIFGHRQKNIMALACGLVMMLYTWFITNSWLIVLIGAILMVLPFKLRF